MIFTPGCSIETIYNIASTYRSCSSISRLSMTFMEGLRLLLDMAAVDKTRVVSKKLSCTGYDKSKDKTESSKKRM